MFTLRCILEYILMVKLYVCIYLYSSLIFISFVKYHVSQSSLGAHFVFYIVQTQDFLCLSVQAIT